MGVFISFSPFLSSDRGESLRGVLKAAPIEKVLIESDFSYSKDIPINLQVADYSKKLVNLYYTAAKIKNMDTNQFRKVVYANGKVFTDRAFDRQ
ncbi:MAG: TatD family hydrolase, partial [Spirochaetales bacterium]|nr:TatD family hydrolase [Spirochaetales bacterium]